MRRPSKKKKEKRKKEKPGNICCLANRVSPQREDPDVRRPFVPPSFPLPTPPFLFSALILFARIAKMSRVTPAAFCARPWDKVFSLTFAGRGKELEEAVLSRSLHRGRGISQKRGRGPGIEGQSTRVKEVFVLLMLVETVVRSQTTNAVHVSQIR